MNRSFRPMVHALAITLALAAAGLEAQQTTPDALLVTATNLTAADEAANGAPRADESVRGGDRLRYDISFTNLTDRPVRNVVLNKPVPQGFQYIAGSASATRSDAPAVFSADGGATFSLQPMEDVIVDGRTVRRPIPAHRYTHVRWTVDGSVEPGADVHAHFDTSLAVPDRVAAAAAAGTI
jgi:uncharacterized repeat protein (TIGR01451 family)